MDAMVEVLEQELASAFEVKDRKSLHRYVLLLSENIVRKESYETQQLEIKSDIKILAESQKQGFDLMDKRFEDMLRYMDKRFEQVDKRFEDMFRYMDKRFEDMNNGMNNRFNDMNNSMNSRFEDMNNRFNDMSKKFTMSSTILNIGIGIIICMTIIFEFIR